MILMITFVFRLDKWVTVSLSPPSSASALPEKFPLPDYPLLPASKGFCLSLTKALQYFKTALKDSGIWE